MHTVREPAVSGVFYPSSKQLLTNDVKALLNEVTSKEAVSEAQAKVKEGPQTYPKAIIVPHAGYIYSGKTAAKAYSQLASGRHTIKRVILLGPAHRMLVNGLALPDVDFFATPLGRVALDQDAMSLIAGLGQVDNNAAAHALEHSLEVQLPFLQTVLDDFKLVPLLVGNATPTEVAQVLDVLWGGAETLIVISSDLSHYLPYGLAQDLDKETVQNILNLDGVLTHKQACGGTPVNGFVLAAMRHQLKPELLDLCNSGDTAGDKRHVVGYASIAFRPSTSTSAASHA